MKRAADTIISCLKEKNMSQTQLAESLGEDRRHLNQQLHRQNDMKVERFIEVLDHIGYRVEIVENDGIRKVSSEYANQIIETRKPEGKFWLIDGEKYIGIDNEDGQAWVDEFSSKEECFAWLKR